MTDPDDRTDGAAFPSPEPAAGDTARADLVQCPNCCRMARVTSRDMGLRFFRCELCESVGAVPDDGSQ